MDLVINLVMIGNANSGKSQLIKRFLTQTHVEDYHPTGIEELSTSIRVGNITAKMIIWDIGGRFNLDTNDDRVWALIQRGNIFFLAFSVVDPVTFAAVKKFYDSIAPLRADDVFVCLVGCKADLRATANPENIITEEQGQALAKELNVQYFETSAKANEKVAQSFNTSLIFSYKRYLAKKNRTPEEDAREKKKFEQDSAQLIGLMKNNINFVDILAATTLKKIFNTLFAERNENLIEYISKPEILKVLINSLFEEQKEEQDKPLIPSHYLRPVREFACTVFEDDKLIKIMASVSNNSDLLNQLMDSYFSRPYINTLPPKVRRLLTRILTKLFDSQSASMIKYASENKFILRLLKHINDDDVKELLCHVLASEKKLVETSHNLISFTLLESIDLPTTLYSQINDKTTALDAIEGFYKLVCLSRGFSSEVVLSTICKNNYQFPTKLLSLVKESSGYERNEAITFFCDCILRTYSANVLNEELKVGMINLLLEYQQTISDLLKSNSKLTVLGGLTLVNTIIKRRLDTCASLLIPQCVEILLTNHTCNVIHSVITDIITNSLNEQHKELIEKLINDAKLIDRILEEFKQKTSDSDKYFYGHLINISKCLSSCPIVNDIYKEHLNEEWINFMETTVKEMSEKGLCPPNEKLREKHNQKAIGMLGQKQDLI